MILRAIPRLLLAPVVMMGACNAVAQSATHDLLIRNARIVDGRGGPPVMGDVAIDGSRIVAVGALVASTGRKVIDADGRVVAPGFIDLMGQNSLPLVEVRPASESHLRQGITTLFSGEGWSVAPVDPNNRPESQLGLEWTTFADYFRLLERHGIALNVVHNVGAGQVRQVVMGSENRAPTPEELARMEHLVDAAMRDGAAGLSAALIYPPGSYATTDELIALAKVVSRHGGFYAAHMRNEGDQLLDSVEETLRIGREARLPVHIFHLKAGGVRNWALMSDAVARIESARLAGQDVTADIYPYTRSGTSLSALVAPHNFSGGDAAFRASLADPAARARIRAEIERPGEWENIYASLGNDWSKVLIAGLRGYSDTRVKGLSMAEAAELTGKDEWSLFFDILEAGDAFVALASMDEGQKVVGLKAPWMMIDTDQSPTDPGATDGSHPRGFGSFPRILAKYVRDEGVLTLEEAIRRMTSLAAWRLGLADRGVIAPGYAADIVIFDPQRVQDRATYVEPMLTAVGMDYVLVNGSAVIDDGRMTTALPGKVLRHRGRGPPVPAPDIAPDIDRLFSDLARTDSPGCALAAARDGRIVLERGYGMADLEQGVAIRPETVFNIASISKQFTATSILLLAEEGRLSLDDDVRKHVPELPDYGTAITLRQLGNHTSGLRDHAELLGLSGWNWVDDVPDERILDLIARQKSLNFPPGTKYSYSNTGYFLLALVVERLSGQTLGEFARERIFEPLGMTHTRFYDDRRIIMKGRAAGYLREADGNLGAWRPTYEVVGDGGLLASVQDLALWAGNFIEPRLGRDPIRLIAQLTEPGRLADGSVNAHAFGVWVESYRDLPVVAHSGGIPGYAGHFMLFPGERFSVQVLCNQGGLPARELAESVADLMLVGRLTGQESRTSTTETPSKTTSVPAGDSALPARALSEFEGRYYSAELDAMYALRIEDGTLTARVGYRPSVTLVPLGGDRFQFGEDYLVEFGRDRRGDVTRYQISSDELRGIEFRRAE